MAAFLIFLAAALAVTIAVIRWMRKRYHGTPPWQQQQSPAATEPDTREETTP
jgi:hypothetical protein